MSNRIKITRTKSEKELREDLEKRLLETQKENAELRQAIAELTLIMTMGGA